MIVTIGGPLQDIALGDPLPDSEVKALSEYTNWVANACSTDAAASPSGPVDVGSQPSDDNLPGSGNKAKIWNYLIALGFTPVQAAGIYGNIGREGVFDPQSIEDGDEKIDPATGKLVGRTKSYDVFKQLTTAQQDGYGLIGFTPGLSLMEPGLKPDGSIAPGNINGGANWSGIAKVTVTKTNFYYISTQLDVVYGYMKNSNAPDGKNMLQEYQNQATSPGAAASSFQDLVENAGVVADGVRDHIAHMGMNQFGHNGTAVSDASAAEFVSSDPSSPSTPSASPGDGGGTSGCCAAPAPTATADTDTSGTPITGDIQALAQQVMKNKNISFDYGPSGGVAANFIRLARGDEAQTDNGRSVDVQPILLVALLHLAQSHTVTVSSLTDGSHHESPSDPHGMGDAMDLDYLDGTELNDTSAQKQTISTLEQVLPSGSHFGLGTILDASQTVDGKTFTQFGGDNGNSVHFDVVGVNQDDDDKAVAAAAQGSGGILVSNPLNDTSSSSSTCCPSGGSGTGTGDVTLTGSTPAEQAFNYFVTTRGLSPQAAAGIVGNMMTESAGNTENLDTHAHNDISGTHDGIVQWSTSRWNDLKSYEHGKDPYDLGTQLDFAWHELNTDYKSVLDEIKTAPSASAAATDVNHDYEVSGDDSGNRETNAQKIFARYGGGAAGVGEPVSAPTGGGCTDDTTTASTGPVNIIQHDSFGTADGLMGHKPTMIGLHYTAGNEQSVDEIVNDLSDPTGAKGCNKSCSVQLTVDPKGNVYQLTSRLDVITENIINFNDADIGIEIMGPDEQSLLNNKPQFNAVTALVTQLMQQYNIKMVQDFSNKAGLMGHIECDEWSQAHLGDHFGGIYSSDPPVESTDSHTDPGKTYMSKVRAVVGPALSGGGTPTPTVPAAPTTLE